MRGIYIKGMKMPYRCCECKLKYWDGEEDVCPFVGVIASIGRHDDCPLVPVPDHGRLVDADAYRAEMKKRQDAYAEWRDDIKDGGGYGTELYYRVDSVLSGFYEAKLTLDGLPTIIPAEEESGE